MAILLVVLPTVPSWILQNQRLAPHTRRHHLAEAPAGCVRKSSPFGNPGFQERSPRGVPQVRMEAGAGQSSSSQRGAAPRGPGEGWTRPRGRRCPRVAGQGLSFLLNYIIPRGCPSASFSSVPRLRASWGVLSCCSYSVNRCDELPRTNTV